MWKDQVTDPEEIKVFEALDSPNSTWRTVTGLAWQTGIPVSRVVQILKKYDLMLTREADTPSISGSALVGLIEKVGA